MAGNTVYARTAAIFQTAFSPPARKAPAASGKRTGFPVRSFRLRFCRLNAAPENPSFAGKRERAGRVGTGARLPGGEFRHKPEAAFSGKLMYHR